MKRAGFSGAAIVLLVMLLAAPTSRATPATPATPVERVATTGDGAGVRARLSQPDVLRGGFVQEKQLEGFRNPLRSRGAFLLVRGRGIAWDTVEPFASSTVLTRARLLTTLPDGSSRVVLDADSSAGMATVNALLMALVAGDLDALAPQFTLEEELLDDGTWTLALRPREDTLKRVIERIELRGDRLVREVHIREAAGDRTRIVFEDLADTPAATADELARLE